MLEGSIPKGVLDSSSNFFVTPPGKLAVRGGSQVKQTLTANALLHLRPFTPTGAIAIAQVDGSTNHRIWRLTSDLAFFTGVEATSSAYAGTGWAKATAARPVVAELFEKVYVADATADYSVRGSMFSMDGAGTITTPTFDLSGGAEALKFYCLEEYNNVLFGAGYDSKTLSADAPALVRHSMLGTAPDAVGGWDPTAYATIGAKGQRVTAMKKGKGLLLIAKANEMHRLSGFGRALPGWQYTVEGVDNELGAGVSNPLALCYAEGYWYGIGEAGPFRTDGFEVESLVGARRRSWATITSLGYSWVQYHPDRQCVLFGLTEVPPATGRSSTYPNVIWIWDCEREVWAGDIRCSADIYYAHAIPTATVLGPTAIPSNLAFTHASADLTTVAATWTNGDATAATELWVRPATGGGSVLWDTAPAGDTSRTLSGLANGTNYKVKVRHIKSGVASDFTSEVDAYTVLPFPSVSQNPGTPVYVRSTVTIDHGTVHLEVDSVETDSRSITGIGGYDFLSSSGFHLYRSRISDSSWPAAIQYSAYSNVLPVTG